MLPDLSKLKNKLYKFQEDFIHHSIQQGLGPLKDCKRIPMFEGHRHGVERHTEDKEIHDFTPIEGEIAFKPQEDDLETTFEKLYDLGQQMGNAFQKKAFEQMDKSLTKKGQSVNAEGLPTVDAIFAMLEKVEFPLGPDGKLNMSGYKFVGGTKAQESMIKAWKEILTDPGKMNKLERLQKRKEESARAKEANRKLVG
ncbi:MAG: hypothetical protein WD000_07240 [Thermodesulfobacteriota bacterium]